MEEWEKAIGALPSPFQQRLSQVSPALQAATQEIRLRKNCPITLSTPEGDAYLESCTCTGNDLFTVVQHLCEYSLYAHQEELKNGYIMLKNGCRAGISGTASVENGEIRSLRDFTSVCLRVMREHPNCAKDLAFTVKNGEKIHSVLLCGGPASGKSTLLRDLIRQLTGRYSKNRCRMAVVDERGELAPKEGDFDLLRGYPKARGIEQALRTLSPELILFDEIGPEEAAAVNRCLGSGVAVVSSIHADSPEDLLRRPAAGELLAGGGFDCAVMLAGRRRPGVIDRVIPAEELRCSN